MQGAEKAIQTVKDYISAGLVRNDIQEVLSYLTEDIVGIGMGEQGIVRSKQYIADIMRAQLKPTEGCSYSLEFPQVEIRSHKDFTTTVCMEVAVKCASQGETTESKFMQSATLRMEGGVWKIFTIHASPMDLSEESLAAYPMRYGDGALLQTREKIQFQLLEFLNSSLPGGIFITYVEGDTYPLCFINDNLLECLGYDREEFVSRFEDNTMLLIHPEDLKMVQDVVREAFVDESSYRLQLRLMRSDGTPASMMQRSRFVKGDSGKPLLISFLMDITELIVLQSRLEDQTALLEEQAEELRTQQEALIAQSRCLEVSQERYRIALEKTSNIIFDYDLGSRNIMFDNITEHLDSLINTAGRTRNVFFGRGQICEESLEAFSHAFSTIHREEYSGCEFKVRRENSREVWYKMTLIGIRGDNGQVLRAVGMLEDITLRKEIELAYAREEQYHQIAITDVMAYYVINFTQNLFENYQINDSRCSTANKGQSYQDFMIAGSESRLTPEERKQFLDIFSRDSAMAAFDRGEKELTLEYLLRDEDGTGSWVQNIMYLVIDEKSGERKGFLYVKDIDARKRKELELTHKSEFDVLTDIYNKRTVETYISEKLETREGVETGAFMILDIDHFKEINDTYGHPFGDTVLREVSGLLCNNFRSGDIIGRIGGDEFCAFICSSDVEVRMREAAERLNKNIQNIAVPKGGHLEIRCSIGVSACLGVEKTFEELYQEADKALYSVKAKGRNGYAFFGKIDE